MSSFYKPEEGVDAVVLLYWRQSIWRQADVASILLLGVKDSGTCSVVWLFVGYGDIGIDW